MKLYTLKIESIKKETADTITLCFKQPSLRKIKYLPGQYLTLSFRINGRRFLRPYSFSSAPSKDSYLEVTIKKIPQGIVSNYIHEYVNIGDLVEVMEPQGNFCYVPDSEDEQIYFWGVGSGITPLFSIIKELLITTPTMKVNLIYGSKNPESTIFSKTLDQLIHSYPDTFRVTHFYSQYEAKDKLTNIFHGRINRKYILELLKNNNPNSKHYICGPSMLKEAIKETLKELNIPSTAVFYEDFELVIDPKEFENINTQKVTINHQNKNTTVDVTKGKSILEAALDNGLELPYSCQTGNCRTCIGKLKSGKIIMLGLDNERDDIENDSYLLCCSYPLTDNIYLEI